MYKTMKILVLLTLVIFLMVFPGYGMIGYECGTSGANITTLSLLDVDECELPRSSLSILAVQIQLLQINDYASVHVRQCKIEIDRDIRKCGMFSHTSDVANGKASYIYEISRESCNRMHDYGSFQIGPVVIMGISSNQSDSHSVVLGGTIGVDGGCGGTTYVDPYGSWNDVIVQGIIKITLRDYSADVGLKNNKVYLKSGTRCDLNKGHCIDMEGGPTFWDPAPTEKCGGNKYGLLYDGVAEKGIDKDKEILYTVTTSDVIFALISREPITVCGQSLIQTEHPRLFIYEKKDGQQFLQKQRVNVANMDIYAYINSKFVYVERHLQIQIQQVYNDLLMHKCELEREMLRNRLAIATQSPDEFAYYLMKEPGHMAVISGEVVHIIKCIPVEVKIQHLSDCYTHLPVEKNNKTYFMAPRTHILMKTGMQITCNRLLPPMYFVDQEWYGMMPGPTHVYPPGIIKPITTPTWKSKSIKSLATSGIYSSADLDKLREHVMFPAESPAILNSVVRGIMGKTVVKQGGSIVKLLEGPELTKLMESTWENMWRKFIFLGSISAGFLGIFVVVRAVKLIIDTLIHGYALHTVYGWSIYLVGAIWDSLTNLLLHLKRRVEIPSQKEIDVESNVPPELKIEKNENEAQANENETVRINEGRVNREVQTGLERVYPRLQ